MVTGNLNKNVILYSCRKASFSDIFRIISEKTSICGDKNQTEV